MPEDTRIQNLNVRSDVVFDEAAEPGEPTAPGPGNDTVTGTAGPDTLDAGDGNDTVSGGAGADNIDLGPGADVLRDTLSDLNGDVIAGFGLTDMLDITGSRHERGQISFAQQGGQTVVTIGDNTFALAGDFSQGDFMTVSRGTGANMHTVITFEPLLPTLTEGARVDPTKINGVINELFLSGDGQTNFTFEFKSGVSAHANTLGYYKVASNGTISDVHVLIDNTTNAPAAARTVNLGTLADGQSFAFFLIQDGFDQLRQACRTTCPSWGRGTSHDGPTSTPAVPTGAAQRDSPGSLTGATVFHSIRGPQSRAAPIRDLSGVAPGGRELLIGFEDRADAPRGDNDFQDVVVGIRTDDLLV